MVSLVMLNGQVYLTGKTYHRKAGIQRFDSSTLRKGKLVVKKWNGMNVGKDGDIWDTDMVKYVYL